MSGICIIVLWPSPTRHTLPPEQVALRAVVMVLSKPTQSKVTSIFVPIAFFICVTSSLASYIYVYVNGVNQLQKENKKKK